MRGTRWLVAILTVLLVGAACEPVATEPVANNTANTAAELTTNTAPANTNTAGTVESATAEIHPISIPALQALTLDGRDLKLGRVLANTAAYTRYYITYKSGALIISGIMNIPKGDGPFPVLFLNHGYIDTSVYTNGRGLKREQDYFARNGFAVLHSDYRCHADSDCPKSDPLAQRFGYANDVMNAIQAVKTANHPKLDTEQLGMLGHSMGGGVTQQIVVAKPDLIDAAVLYAPVSSDYKDSYERYTIRRPADAKKIVDTYGTAEQQPDFWNNLSPRKFFENISVPSAYHHGTSDADVPYAWTTTSVDLLKTAGKTVTLHTYPGQPHEFTSVWGTFMNRSADFFRENLKP